MRGVRRVCAQRADDGQMIGIRLACSSCLLSAFCTHTIPCLPCAKREHNRRIVQGSKVLCLLKEREVRPLYPLSGGVRHRYRLKWSHFMPDSPRLSAYHPHGSTDLRWPFTRRPDTRTCHLPIHSL